MALFGQQLLTVQYYCHSCHTPFERVKDDDVLQDYAVRKEVHHDDNDRKNAGSL